MRSSPAGSASSPASRLCAATSRTRRRNERGPRRNGLRAPALRPRARPRSSSSGCCDRGGAALGGRLVRYRRPRRVRALHGRVARCQRHDRPVVAKEWARPAAPRHGAAGPLRAEGARSARRRRAPAVPRLADAAPRRVRGHAGVRHRRPAAGGRPRPRAHERRHDRAAVAGERRPRPGRGRAAAAQLRRPLRDRLRLRSRATGDRDRLRGRARPDRARARGISFAMLRRMEDDDESSETSLGEVDELVEELEHESEPRESAAVSR